MAEIIELEFEDEAGTHTLFIERRSPGSVTQFSSDGGDVVKK